MNEPRRIVTNRTEDVSHDPFEKCLNSNLTFEVDDSDDSEDEGSMLKKLMQKINALDDSCKVISNDLNKITINEIKYNTYTKKLESILNELDTSGARTYPLLRGLFGALVERVNNALKKLELIHKKGSNIPEILEHYVKNINVTSENENDNEETELENLLSQYTELKDMIQNFPHIITTSKISCPVGNFQGNRKYFCDIPFSTEYLHISQKHKQSMVTF
jgi:hypothetical protein